MNLMEPVLFFNDSFALCGWVYHTSAAYDICRMEVRQYARTYVNRIPLTSDPMPAALLSDPMIRIPLS